MKRILNVGCGEDTYGTDFVDIYPARDEVKKCNLDVDNLPYKDNTFDEVFSAFNFEHLKNPNRVMKEMARVLKKGGVLIIRTDNAGWWGYHNSKSSYKTHYGGYKYGDHGGEDIHYALYTFHHVENHFKAVNLKIISSKIYARDKMGLPIRIINGLLNKSRFKWMAFPQIEVRGEKQ